jgi:hypothetical protein
VASLSFNPITPNLCLPQLWRCDEVLYVLRSLEQLSAQYPQCTVSGDTLSDPGFHVGVHASLNDGDLGYASAARLTHGMALWVATLLHVAGVEIYVSLPRCLALHSFISDPSNSCDILKKPTTTGTTLLLNPGIMILPRIGSIVFDIKF